MSRRHRWFLTEHSSLTDFGVYVVAGMAEHADWRGRLSTPVHEQKKHGPSQGVAKAAATESGPALTGVESLGADVAGAVP